MNSATWQALIALTLSAVLSAGLIPCANAGEGGPGRQNSDRADKGRPARESQGKRRADGSRSAADPFHNLTPEQREKLREAVRRAWSDPAVLEARDKLKTAAESYQDALTAAIKKSNPEIADTVDGLRRDSASALRIYGSPKLGSGRKKPGGGGRDRKGYEGFLTMENPSFLRDLDESSREIYREAHRQAMRSPEVKAKLESLKALHQSDEEMRKRRIAAIFDVHKAIRAALTEADPRVRKFLSKTNHAEGRRRPSDRPADRAPGGKPEPN